MSDQVQTVLGLVPATQLGRMHSHEHLAARPPDWLLATDPDLDLGDGASALADLEAFRGAGGGALAELTTVDYGRDLDALAELSRRSGVHILATTGFNKGVYCRPFTEGRDPSAVAQELAVEASAGRVGLVKAGTSLHQIHPWEEVALRAAARTHQMTGLPVITHTEAGTMAPEQLRILAGEGVGPEQVIISHLDRNPDLELHRRLAARGTFMSYDQLPKQKYRTEGPATDLIVALAREGLHTQVLVGGDYARRSLFTGWGGAPGLAYILTHFASRLQQALDEAGLNGRQVVDDILVHNPRRAFRVRS